MIANDGTETETVVAGISTLTAGANTWTLSTGSNGANQARAQWSTASGPSGPWTDIAAYATNFTIASGLAASGTVTPLPPDSNPDLDRVTQSVLLHTHRDRTVTKRFRPPDDAVSSARNASRSLYRPARLREIWRAPHPIKCKKGNCTSQDAVVLSIVRRR